MFQEILSDSELSVEPIKAPSRKRKAAPRSGTSTAKKAKVTASSSSSNSVGVLNKRSSVLASSVIANGVEFYKDTENQEDAAEAVVKLAQYTKQLETALALSKSSEGGAPVAKTKAELEAAVENIKKAAVSGITKQMKWRPSCKTDGAKWVYDGVCADADVFGIVLGLDGPPTWKVKKFTKDNFIDLLGPIRASARYSSLRLTGTAVYVRYNADTGEFKFSGYYGIGY